MRAVTTVVSVLAVGLFVQACAAEDMGCSREEAPEFSAAEEQITRNDVVADLGEPIETFESEDGRRVDIYEYDQFCAFAPLFPLPIAFPTGLPDQMLTVEYGPDGSFLTAEVLPYAETPEDAYKRHVKLEEECNLPYSEAIQLDAGTQLQVASSCEQHGYSYEVADRWRCLAARTGDGAFKRQLGMHYRDSAEPTKDFIEAYKLFSLAVAEGERSALWSRDHLARQMSEDDISKAQRLVAEWQPNSAKCGKMK